MTRGYYWTATARRWRARLLELVTHGVQKCTNWRRFTCKGCGRRVCWCYGSDGCVSCDEGCTHRPRCRDLCNGCWCVRDNRTFERARRDVERAAMPAVGA